MDIAERPPEDLAALIAGVDRSERIDVVYEVVDGELRERQGPFDDAPPWSPARQLEHVAFCEPILARGGVLLAPGDGAGIAVVEPAFEPGLAWLAWFHVSRPHRRRGVATALWREVVARSTAAGASLLYVSATPTGSAVGFYLSRGCTLAAPPHAELFAHEPDDVHLVCDLGGA